MSTTRSLWASGGFASLEDRTALGGLHADSGRVKGYDSNAYGNGLDALDFLALLLFKQMCVRDPDGKRNMHKHQQGEDIIELSYANGSV